MLVQHLQAAWWKTTSAFITYIDYWIQTIQQRTPDSSNMTSSACPCTHPMLTGRLSRHAFLRSTTPNIYSQYWKCISQNFVSNFSLTNIPTIHIYVCTPPRYKYFQIHLPYLNRITHALQLNTIWNTCGFKFHNKKRPVIVQAAFIASHSHYYCINSVRFTKP